jgi:ppGpp synthetase/RelA/SpoT-type nucleotidyltranferase
MLGNGTGGDGGVITQGRMKARSSRVPLVPENSPTRSPSRELPFDFTSFNHWYEDLCRSALEPARLTFERILREQIEIAEVELGVGRFRQPQSRIKNPLRLWAKINSPKYSEKIQSLDEIPGVIDDLVGVRLVCTNKSDVSTIIQVFERFDRSGGASDYGIAIEDGSERNYIEHPKESGYRAFHANLLTKVPRLGGLVTVRGEVQVRTLLQDGWGELTHEDTYKPGQDVPRLVHLLSLRMGEVLATVDDIAEDIQSELGRLAQAAVMHEETESSDGPDAVGVNPESTGADISPELVLLEAARLVSSSTKPTALSIIANQLQATFGSDISRDWMGYGSFKHLLRTAVPDIQIIPVGPNWVIPQGVEPDETWPASLRQAFLSGPKTT